MPGGPDFTERELVMSLAFDAPPPVRSVEIYSYPGEHSLVEALQHQIPLSAPVRLGEPRLVYVGVDATRRRNLGRWDPWKGAKVYQPLSFKQRMNGVARDETPFLVQPSVAAEGYVLTVTLSAGSAAIGTIDEVETFGLVLLGDLGGFLVLFTVIINCVFVGAYANRLRMRRLGGRRFL